jgi:hypothetical protein
MSNEKITSMRIVDDNDDDGDEENEANHRHNFHSIHVGGISHNILDEIQVAGRSHKHRRMSNSATVDMSKTNHANHNSSPMLDFNHQGTA